MGGFGHESSALIIGYFGTNLFVTRFAAHENNGSVERLLVASKRLKEVRAGGAGHMIIEDDEIGLHLPRLIEAVNGFCR